MVSNCGKWHLCRGGILKSSKWICFSGAVINLESMMKWCRFCIWDLSSWKICISLKLWLYEVLWTKYDSKNICAVENLLNNTWKNKSVWSWISLNVGIPINYWVYFSNTIKLIVWVSFSTTIFNLYLYNSNMKLYESNDAINFKFCIKIIQ